MHVEVDFSEVHDLTERLQALPGVVASELGSAADDIATRLAGAAKDNAPADRGRLRASLTGKWSRNGSAIRIVYGSNADQAGPMETGTDPFFPPPSELRGWAHRVLGDESAAFAVARSIAEHGIEERRYLRDALAENSHWVIQRLNRAIVSSFEEVGLK